MTTSVTVKAHCAKTKQVEVRVSGKLERILEDGESVEVYAYDNREIQVKEVDK